MMLKILSLLTKYVKKSMKSYYQNVSLTPKQNRYIYSDELMYFPAEGNGETIPC